MLTTVDIEAEHQRLARETFNEAGIPPQRARTIAGAALDVLPRLTDGHYDLVFCDGDKAEYAAYLKEALRLLRPGGVVAFDNALWHDRVADPAQRDEETVGRSATSARRSPRTTTLVPRAAARRRRPAGRQEGVGPEAEDAPRARVRRAVRGRRARAARSPRRKRRSASEAVTRRGRPDASGGLTVSRRSPPAGPATRQPGAAAPGRRSPVGPLGPLVGVGRRVAGRGDVEVRPRHVAGEVLEEQRGGDRARAAGGVVRVGDVEASVSS